MIEPRIKGLMKTGNAIFETTHYCKDGSVIPVEVHANIIEFGGHKYILSAARDITQRKKDETALIDREQRFRSLFENNPVPIFVQDTKSNYINVNAVGCKLLGYSKEEILAAPAQNMILPEKFEEARENFRRALRGESVTYEAPTLGKSGERLELSVTLIPVMVDNEVAGIYSVAEDITQRKKAAEALRQSEEKYRTILEEMGEGYYEIDAKGNLIFFNEAGVRLYGYTMEEMLGMNYKVFTPHELWSAQVAAHEDVFRTGIPKRLHPTVAVKKDGTNIYMEDSIFPIRNEKGEIVGLRGIARDVTDRTKAEEELKKALDTINITLEGTIEAIAMMSELRDPYTAGHQRMVTELAIAIADEVGMPLNHKPGLRVAGLLHDIGKVRVPSEILSKPGKLSTLEMGLAKAHAEAGYEIVKAIKFPWPVCRIIIEHHERIDGSGYPHGLKGDQITPEAKILAVADVVEAMMSHRPYRPALGEERALDEITRNKGTLYDETVADACIRLFTEKGFKFSEYSHTNPS
ncbi:MAG: PAS domain S-box protein [Chloroflexi bacterium]|nr:PAS domain S-box protein [Chloroflexota bacterium]